MMSRYSDGSLFLQHLTFSSASLASLKRRAFDDICQVTSSAVSRVRQDLMLTADATELAGRDYR